MRFANKATPELVSDAIWRAAKLLPGRQPVVLWDGYGAVGEVRRIDCASEDPAAVDAYPAETTVFIYACTQDDIGGPFIRRVIAKGAKFLPISWAEPSQYINIDTDARRSLETEYRNQKLGGFAKWDFGPGDFINLIQALAITSNLPGAYVELGCFRGSSGGAVLNYLRAKRRKMACHFLDVFSGFDYEEAERSADALWKNSHATEGYEVVSARLKAYAANCEGLEVQVYKTNCITEPLPAAITEIAVANIDVDLYEAVKAGLEKVAPLVVPGGILIAEDPGHSPALIGARVALDEFLESDLGAMFTPIVMESGQTFMVRR